MFKRSTQTIVFVSVAALLLGTAPVLAAGTVTGSVVNGLTGQPIPGATVTLEGTDITTISGVDGVFQIQAPAGTYAAVVSKPDFTSERVTDVEVSDGETAQFSAVLTPRTGTRAAEEEAAFGEEITVTTTAADSSTEALLTERKQSAQISDLIGAEEMSKNTGGDAAGALQRVTGVSLQNSKYVYVRGLGDRYSNTTLNGAKLPSTELEKKVVPLDLFPTDVLQKVRVSKSYTVDKPGDFAAGFVELETLDFPANQTGTLGISVEHDSVTTGEDYLKYPGGLSFSGDGGQPLPSSVPSESLLRFSPFSGEGFTTEELEQIGEQLVGDWRPTTDAAALAQGYDLSYGNTVGKLGMVFSATYGNDFTVRNEDRNFFFVGADGGVVPKNTYSVDAGEESVTQAAVGNFSYKFSNDHHVQLRSLYTNSATIEARTQAGFFSDQNTDIRDDRLSFFDREIVSLQLQGEHYMSGVFPDGSLVDWIVSGSRAATDENRRETVYEESPNGEFLLTPDAQSGFMYFNDLEDELLDAKANWTTFVSNAAVNGSVKTGVALTERERDFNGRRLRFRHRSTRGLDLTLPPDQLFTVENIGPHFEIEEVTRPTDTYDGNHEVAAGYAQADLTWADGVWRLIGGARFERSEIDLVTINRNAPELIEQTTEIDEDDLLPSLTLVFGLTPKQNLRAAYSRTVNRPEFRELAPFKFTHLVGGFSVVGNPELTSADIDSYDLRWEWFPSSDEVVAASVFFKDFSDPIEAVAIGAAEVLETYANAEGAENVGAEIEARQGLERLSDALDAFTVIANYTYVDSEIEIDPKDTILTNLTRPLVGQPETVANLVLEWSEPRWGATVRLLTNYTGDKVSRGGASGLPDVVEEARTVVDLVWRQDLPGVFDGLGFKLSGTNLLDEERLWTQGGETYRLYDVGRTYGLSVKYGLF